MRLPTIRRRSLPAAAGGGLVAVSVAAAVCVAALAGGHGDAGAAPASPVAASQAAPVPAAAGTAGGPGASTAAAGGSTVAPSPVGSGSTVPGASTIPGASTALGGASLSGATPTHLVVPDVIATAAGSVTAADLAKISKLAGVRAVLAIDGAQVKVDGVRLTVLAASPAALRPWTPPATAASARVWSAFGAGELITSATAAGQAHLAAGTGYPVAAAVSARITDGGTALLGIDGVDGVVSAAEGKKLGLVRNLAVLVNAPAADATVLTRQVQAALGPGARAVRLVSAQVSTSLPVDATAPSSGRPGSYLQLFQASAARYCPALSWTVLAAIGQIESADGQNVGPSSAGALGPMQFEPSTWAQWGTDGFGDTGPPDILNPFDAVPSAARMLCADGAASGSSGLRTAIFAYNHADWYVDEVLTLAAEYAREY